ncbi:hypothetical protein D3C72_2270720 [compost metagenome]
MLAQVRQCREAVDFEILWQDDEVRFREQLALADARHLGHVAGCHGDVELTRLQLCIERRRDAGPEPDLV